MRVNRKKERGKLDFSLSRRKAIGRAPCIHPALRQVELRGTALSMNDEWWFNYRGTNLHVENMKNLPNWRGRDLHYCAVTIKGVLKVEMLPAIREYDTDLKQQYIVRNASWEYAGPLLFPEVMP